MQYLALITKNMQLAFSKQGRATWLSLKPALLQFQSIIKHVRFVGIEIEYHII